MTDHFDGVDSPKLRCHWHRLMAEGISGEKVPSKWWPRRYGKYPDRHMAATHFFSLDGVAVILGDDYRPYWESQSE